MTEPDPKDPKGKQKGHKQKGSKGNSEDDEANNLKREAMSREVEKRTRLSHVFVPDTEGEGIFRANASVFGDEHEPRSFSLEKSGVSASIKVPRTYNFLSGSASEFVIKLDSHAKNVVREKSVAANMGLGLSSGGNAVNLDFAVDRTHQDTVDKAGSTLRLLLTVRNDETTRLGNFALSSEILLKHDYFQVQLARLEADKAKLKDMLKKAPEAGFKDLEGARKFVDQHGLLYCASETWGGYVERRVYFSSESISSLSAKVASIKASASQSPAISSFLSANADFQASAAKTVTADKSSSMTLSREFVDGGSKTLIELSEGQTDQKRVDTYKEWHQSVLSGQEPTVLHQTWLPFSCAEILLI